MTFIRSDEHIYLALFARPQRSLYTRNLNIYSFQTLHFKHEIKMLIHLTFDSAVQTNKMPHANVGITQIATYLVGPNSRSSDFPNLTTINVSASWQIY
jgi:hypothetical protein